ncbi:MAG: peptidoglycan-binding domain-containing protein [Pyrinomonadaceae bacterium]
MPISYQVKQGDCIFSIAVEHGFFADTIWDHPQNKELKEKRGDPHVLLPGDMVFVPDKRVKEVSEPTDQVHKFRCKNTPKDLRIRLMCLDNPIGNMKYALRIDGVEKEGKTDADGWLRESISPNAKTAKLSLDDGTEYELKLGKLDPADEISGIQGRLYSLGYFEGSVDGRMSDETKAALEVFQRSQNLDVTGEPDRKTRDLLIEMTGK